MFQNLFDKQSSGYQIYVTKKQYKKGFEIIHLVSIMNVTMSYIVIPHKQIFDNLKRKLVVEDKIMMTDLMCLTSYNIMMYLYPFCPIIVLKSIKCLPRDLITANDLKFPKQGKKLILCHLVVTAASLCQSLTTFFVYYMENNIDIWQWIVFGISQLYIPIWFFVPIIPIFFLLVWIEQFSKICKENSGIG